jgi:hypothetical protein
MRTANNSNRTAARLPHKRFQFSWRPTQDLGIPQHLKPGVLLSLAVKSNTIGQGVPRPHDQHHHLQAGGLGREDGCGLDSLGPHRGPHPVTHPGAGTCRPSLPFSTCPAARAASANPIQQRIIHVPDVFSASGPSLMLCAAAGAHNNAHKSAHTSSKMRLASSVTLHTQSPHTRQRNTHAKTNTEALIGLVVGNTGGPLFPNCLLFCSKRSFPWRLGTFKNTMSAIVTEARQLPTSDKKRIVWILKLMDKRGARLSDHMQMET